MDEIDRLWNLYEKYKETAEQHEFPLLFHYDLLLMPGYHDLKTNPSKEHEAVFKRALEHVLKNLGIKLS